MPRWTLQYRGEVQGVGFRATVRQIAAGFAVTGFVQNLADGGVRVVAEGADGELGEFALAVETAFARRIRGVTCDSSPGTGEFSDFSIAY